MRWCWLARVCAVGCTPESGVSESSISSTRSAITGGNLDVDGRFGQVASVALGSSCSGVLITPNHILTAAHCVQNAFTGSVTFNLTRGPGESREVHIASCAMYNAYTVSNRGCLREELLEGREPIDAALAQGERCGVLRARPSVCPAPLAPDIAQDVAVLQLERPIPPPGSAEDPSFAAGDLFLDPIPLADASAVFEPSAIAVGFAGGRRRFAELTPAALGAQMIEPTSLLEGGDSGGPLLVRDTTGELFVYGVAQAMRPGESIWNGVAAQPDVLEPNPLQENCNLDVELLAGVDPVGDVCDPIACGETQLPLREVTGEIDGRPASVWTMRQLEVDARSRDPQEARTGFRFCPCAVASADSLAVRQRCAQPINGDCRPNDLAAYDRVVADRSDEPATWRFQSLGSFSVAPEQIVDPDPGAPLILARTRLEALVDYDAFETTDLFSPDLSVSWAQATDETRWSVTFSETRDPNDPLPGVQWTHTPGPSGAPFPPEVRGLTSHYWSGHIQPDREALRPFPC